MPKENITISIPVQSLIDSISALDIRDKLQLWKLLETELANAEEEMLENDPTIRAEIHEARAAYRAGDYQTIDEYLAKRQR